MADRKIMLDRKTFALLIVAAATLAGGAYYFLSKRTPVPLVQMGLPMYPGAEILDSTTVMKRLSQPGQPSAVNAVVLLTEDHPLRVVSFYQETLKDKVKVLEMARGGVPSAILAVGAGTDTKWLTISIDVDTGKTQILITSLTTGK